MIGFQPVPKVEHGQRRIGHITQRFQGIGHDGGAKQAGAPKRDGAFPCDGFDKLGASLKAVRHFFGQDGERAGNGPQRITDCFVEKGVGADFVTGVLDCPNLFGSFLCRIPGEEKRGGHAIPGQHIQDGRRSGAESFIEGRPAPDIGFHVKAQGYA